MKKLMLLTLGLVVSGSAFAVGPDRDANCRDVLQRVAAIKAQQQGQPAPAPAAPTPAPVAPAR